MTNTEVSDEALDTSLNELVTTGELEESIKGASSEDIEGLIAFIKAELNDKKLLSLLQGLDIVQETKEEDTKNE